MRLARLVRRGELRLSEGREGADGRQYLLADPEPLVDDPESHERQEIPERRDEEKDEDHHSVAPEPAHTAAQEARGWAHNPC